MTNMLSRTSTTTPTPTLTAVAGQLGSSDTVVCTRAKRARRTTSSGGGQKLRPERLSNNSSSSDRTDPPGPAGAVAAVPVRPNTVNLLTGGPVNLSSILSTSSSIIASGAFTPSILADTGLNTPLKLHPDGSFSFGGTPLIYSPGTFASLEQTLLQLERQQTNQRTTLNLIKEGGLSGSSIYPSVNNSSVGAMPPTMSIKREHEGDTDDYSEDDNDSNSGDYAPPPYSSSSRNASEGGRKPRGGDGAVDYSVTSPGYSSTDSGSVNMSSTGGSTTPRRATGPRRSRNNVKLTPEEEERRNLRRERNKHAAAKCRQKRVDQVNTLLEETQGLEDEQSRLQEEIKTFQQEKAELEFILEAHRMHCGVLSDNNASANVTPSTTYSTNVPVIKIEGSVNVLAPSSVAAASAHFAPTTTTTMTANKRPSSFLVPSSNVGISSSSNGLMMSTPSGDVNIFMLGLDSMMDGHTGLTPITGMPSGPGQTPSGNGGGGTTTMEESIAQNLSSKVGGSGGNGHNLMSL